MKHIINYIRCANSPCLNGGTCTKPKACGFVCACTQEPVAYYGAICENSVSIALPSPNCVYSQEETLYFYGPQLPKLRFTDINQNIFTAYNTENINNLCAASFTLIGTSCYRIIADSLYDWNQAKSQCLVLNSNLAWFDNAQEFDLVRGWLNGLYLTNDVWVDGREQNNVWLWEYNNTNIADFIITPNWAPGQPQLNSAQNALLLSRSSGYMFVNEAPEKRLYSMMCKKPSFYYDNTNTILTLNRQLTAMDSFGNPLIGYSFLTNVTQFNDFTHVLTPSTNTYATIFSRYPLQYGQYFVGEAYTYTSPFQLPVCGDLTSSQIEKIRVNVKQIWLSIRPEFSQCQCFDIYIISAEKFTDTLNQVSTLLSYVARANQLVIESDSNGPLPLLPNVFNSLAKIGFSQCQARSKRSTLLDVNVAAASLEQPDYVALAKSVKNSLVAVRPDYLTNKKSINAIIVSNNDALDINSKTPVTQVYLQVLINNQPVNFYTQTEFDTQRLIDELNYQNENNSLTVLRSSEIYTKNYFFNLISSSRVMKQDYYVIESEIKAIFLSAYSQFTTNNVSASIIWQEEYLDENRNIVFSLSVLISVDKKPVDKIIILDRQIFAKLRSVPVTMFLTYNLSLPNLNTYLQPLSKALTFYSNILVCKRDYKKFETLVKEIVKEFKKTTSLNNNEVNVILANQEMYVHRNGTPYWKIFVLTTQTFNNELIDLRMDSLHIVENIRRRINFMSSNGEKYLITWNNDDLLDMKYHFSLFIEGKINQKLSADINRAIELTWNLTAYQTKNFELYFAKNYKFTFMPSYEIEIDTDGKLQTKIIYFISSYGKLVNEEEFTLIPKLNWLQDTFDKFNLPYVLLDGNDESLKPYKKLYYVDFSGYVDPLDEQNISNTILGCFRNVYKGNYSADYNRFLIDLFSNTIF